jgi:hypothetical protein
VSANRFVRIVGLLTLLAAGGCPLTNDTGPPDGVSVGPDVTAISTVVKALYGLHGRGRIIFLGSDDGSVDSDMLAQAGTAVQEELGVRVLPESAADRSDLSLPVLTPKDPETGETGISIQLGRFRVEGDNRLAVSAWAILSGLNAQEYDIVLERAADGWVIVQMNEGAVA